MENIVFQYSYVWKQRKTKGFPSALPEFTAFPYIFLSEHLYKGSVFFEVFKISPTPFLPSSVGGRNLWLLGNQQNFVSIFILVAYSLFSVTPTQIYLGYSRIKPQIEISLKKERALLC